MKRVEQRLAHSILNCPLVPDGPVNGSLVCTPDIGDHLFAVHHHWQSPTCLHSLLLCHLLGCFATTPAHLPFCPSDGPCCPPCLALVTYMITAFIQS